MVQDVRRCYNCKIGAIGDMEIREAYEKLYVDGVLKDEYKIAKRKGLIRVLSFLTILRQNGLDLC